MAKILLVEDDKSLREIYGVRLMAEGYEIVSAGDGEEALAMAIKERPSLIVSDVMMPKISGFDMLDILRSTTETKDVKVIMMTALSSEDQRARGESLGADRYLVKSQVGIEDVVRTVHDVLGDGLPGAAPAPITSNVSETVAPVEAPAAAPMSTSTPAAPAAAPTPVASAPFEVPSVPVAAPTPVVVVEPSPVSIPAPAPVAAPATPAFQQAPQFAPAAAPTSIPVQQAPAYAAPAPVAPSTPPQPVYAAPTAPATAPYPTPAPAFTAPAPAPAAQTYAAPAPMPQPTTPFAAPAPLGERVIAPLNDLTTQSGVSELSAQIDQALNSGPGTASTTPPTL